MDRKPGIVVEIPGFGKITLRVLVTDYTGTHACGGALSSVRGRLDRLAKLVDIIVLTADTFGTVQQELVGLPVKVVILSGVAQDVQKKCFLQDYDVRTIVAMGNGRNDRLMLATVRDAGGVAIAVDNGEGCAVEALQSANIFVHGAANALDILLDTNRLKATLRT